MSFDINWSHFLESTTEIEKLIFDFLQKKLPSFVTNFKVYGLKFSDSKPTMEIVDTCAPWSEFNSTSDLDVQLFLKCCFDGPINLNVSFELNTFVSGCNISLPVTLSIKHTSLELMLVLAITLDEIKLSLLKEDGDYDCSGYSKSN